MPSTLFAEFWITSRVTVSKRGLDGGTSSPVENLYRPMFIAVIAVMMMQMSVVHVVNVVAVRDDRVVAALGGLSTMQVTRML